MGKALDSKGQQALEAKPLSGKALDSNGQALEAKLLIGKVLPYKPRDSETTDLKDLRNHAFLHIIPYSGSKKINPS